MTLCDENFIFLAGKIPDEQTALQMAPSAVAGMIPGQPTWPSNVISQVILTLESET